MSETPTPDYDDENTVYATDPEAEGSVSVGDGEEYDEPYHDPQTLYFDYHVRKLSTIEISEKYGIHHETVGRWMDTHDIPLRDPGEANKLAANGANRPWEQGEWLRQEYADKGTEQIADEQGVSPETIRKALYAFDINVRPPGHPPYQEKAPNLADPEWLREEYGEKKRTLNDIAADEGVSPTTVYRALIDAGIERRSRREAQLRRYERENAVPKHVVSEPGTVARGANAESEMAETTVGGRSYSGPATGLDHSWASNLGDVDREMWVPYRNERWLRWQYEELENSTHEMAETCGVANTTICSWMDKFGIECERGKAGRHRDEEWLRKQYRGEGKTIYEMAEICGVGATTIRSWMDKFGIERDLGREVSAQYADEEWLRKQYRGEGKTTYEMAEICGVSQSTICSWMDRFGIERVQGKAGQHRDEEWLREQYCENGNSTYEIADVCGVSQSTIGKWIDRFGIEREQGKAGQHRDEEWLREQYCENGKSTYEMADICGVSHSTIGRWMDRFGIERDG